MRERVERYYAQHPEATQEQVRRATGAPRKAVRKAFDALVLAGRIKRAKAMALKDCSGDCSPE